MSKESFQYPETKDLFRHIEEVSQRSSVSRAVAFEDFLQCSVSALGHPLMEDEYLATIEKHKGGRKGKRGVDVLAKAFADLIHLTESSDADLLGDLHQGAITYGERGQFMTPAPIARMCCQMNLPTEATGLEDRRSIADPACGSGRMLLAAAAIQPNWHFVGCDIDRRCVQMACINMSLRNYYSHIVWGNSLSNETKLIYETGRVQVWGNAIRKVHRVPLPDREPETIELPSAASAGKQPEEPPTLDGPGRQLHLF